ncbi:MAG: sugar phosphate isomerase/epimerase, partial [Planctomycetes bacterium]|nr:sugar phosphate isomerase/epimerase [Planctomycetota bacterium]
MSTPHISVQLYSVREQATENYEQCIRAIADMGFTNVEPAGFPGTTPEAAGKLFSELGLKAPSAHSALPIGDNKQAVLDAALATGCKYLITGCPPNFKEDFKDHDSIKKLAALYCEAAETAAEHGMQVGYHNHDWDLIEVDGKRGYQTFLENTPDTVLWEADLYWVTRAGIKPTDFIKEIGVRGKLLHFKDGAINYDESFTEAETAD